MFAENFYIALYDDERQAINFPYYVDTVDADIPDPAVWEPFGVGNARGSTAYVLRTGRPLILNADVPSAARRSRRARGRRRRRDRVARRAADRRWSDDRRRRLPDLSSRTSATVAADRDLLAFVGQHIGAALTRVRAIEETRQRNAELALVNEIGQALAKQLDFGAIIELVGDRVRSIFDSRSLFIALHDADDGHAHRSRTTSTRASASTEAPCRSVRA